MSYFIRDIFEKKANDKVHSQMIRFGKGIFENRAVTGMRITTKVKLSTTFEVANDVADWVACNAGRMKISGVILSKKEIAGLEGSFKKSLHNYEISKELAGEELKKIISEAYYALLDIEAPGISLKCKKKLPKPGKSADAKADDKFCVLEADLKFKDSLKNEFFFDAGDFKKAMARHTYNITEIIKPAGEEDAEKIRVMAKRKGKLIRELEIDGKTERKEIDFEE